MSQFWEYWPNALETALHWNLGKVLWWIVGHFRSTSRDRLMAGTITDNLTQSTTTAEGSGASLPQRSLFCADGPVPVVGRSHPHPRVTGAGRTPGSVTGSPLPETVADASPEEWRDVVGYEGLYEVSDHGRVRRHVHAPKTTKSKPGRLISISPKFGRGRTSIYMRVQLWKGGRSRDFLVHRLVWNAFFGGLSDDVQIHHQNENTLDNRPSNLRSTTPALHRHLHAGQGVTSAYRHVSRVASGGWTANVGGKALYFKSEIEAARAADAYAIEAFGADAILNFPQEARHVA